MKPPGFSPPSLLGLRPEGDARLIRDVEARIDLYALAGIGFWPAGPWWITVTRDVDGALKQDNHRFRRIALKCVAGALVYFDGKAWAEKAREVAADTLGLCGETGTKLCEAGNLQAALEAAAARVMPPVWWTAESYKAHVERLARKELER